MTTNTRPDAQPPAAADRVRLLVAQMTAESQERRAS
jgi:hypothetical protein